MKKIVAIVLACCMLVSVFATAANAETRGDNTDAALAAVADKLDPSVIKCLYSAVDDGRYFEIRYHGVTEDELIAQIKAISYAETSGYDLGEGEILVGLPYSSVVTVAALENIDYITLPTGLQYEPPFNNEGGFYIIGTMTDWQLNTNYELTEDYLHSGTYYSWLYMEPDDSFMVVYSPDRKTLDDAEYYPKSGKAFNQNGTIIKEKGFYTFEFRPACDGGITYFEDEPAYWFETSGGERVQTWYYNCIFCLGYYRAPQEREPVYDNLTEGYYVVGTMTDWKLDGNYKLNSYNALWDVTLRMCDSFKVAYTPDGKNITRWYPDGEGNAYNEDVRRITEDSMFNYITFSPDGSFDESWTTHYGMINVVSAVPPSEPDPFPIPVEAPIEAPTEAPKEGELYRERLKEYYNLVEYEEDIGGLYYYKELYYHLGTDGEIDWALINCYCNIQSPVEYTNVVGNRVLNPGTQYYPFDACYGIYDVKNDKFVDATNKAAYQYDNFVRAFDEVVGEGRPLGDIDNDDELTVVDVTMIQRCEAQIMDYPVDDTFSITYDYSGVHYYTDFNRDGDRDILDATCIQRYLVGMPYAIG